MLYCCTYPMNRTTGKSKTVRSGFPCHHSYKLMLFHTWNENKTFISYKANKRFWKENREKGGVSCVGNGEPPPAPGVEGTGLWDNSLEPPTFERGRWKAGEQNGVLYL